jgi:hypothetical protein
MLVEAAAPLQVGASYRLLLRCGAGDTSFEGAVVWCRPVETPSENEDEPRFRVGLKLENLRLHQIDGLVSLIQRDPVLTLLGHWQGPLET